MNRCDTCHNTGFVIYRKVVGAQNIECIAKCACDKGNTWAYEGDVYRIPSITEVMAQP